MRSIFTPACEAAYSSSMICGSSSAFILAMMRAGLPSAACFASLRIAATMRLCSVNGDCHTCFMLARLPEAGELLEHLGDVGADLLVRR